jgi:hypothetical protein
MDLKVWSGPVGVARIVCVVSAIWLLAISFAGVVGWAGYSPGKTVLPLVLTFSSLAFLTGYQLGMTARR